MNISSKKEELVVSILPRYLLFDCASDSTSLPQEVYENDVTILRFFRFYDFLQWMKEWGIFVVFMYSYSYVITFMTILR